VKEWRREGKGVDVVEEGVEGEGVLRRRQEEFCFEGFEDVESFGAREGWCMRHPGNLG
jgi:hypothetical protein